MRRVLASAVVALGLGGALSVAPGTADPAAADCPPPALAVDPGARLVADRPLVVRGSAFTGCPGPVHCDPGCTGRCDEPEPVRPLTGVDLSLEQDGRTWRLGTADAVDGGAIRWRVDLPATVRPGPATLVPGTGLEQRVLVVRRR